MQMSAYKNDIGFRGDITILLYDELEECVGLKGMAELCRCGFAYLSDYGHKKHPRKRLLSLLLPDSTHKISTPCLRIRAMLAALSKRVF